jgi:hypothetical protein
MKTKKTTLGNQRQEKTKAEGKFNETEMWFLTKIIKLRKKGTEMGRADYEKPMRTGRKQGKTQFNCFYL